MTKKLTIKEVALLMGIIPENHAYLTLVELEDAKKNMVFTEEENRKFDIRSEKAPDGRYYLTFNEEASTDYLKTVKFKVRAISAIAEVLKKMDDEKTLDARFLSLYKKFATGGENANTN